MNTFILFLWFCSLYLVVFSFCSFLPKCYIRVAKRLKIFSSFACVLSLCFCFCKFQCVELSRSLHSSLGETTDLVSFKKKGKKREKKKSKAFSTYITLKKRLSSTATFVTFTWVVLQQKRPYEGNNREDFGHKRVAGRTKYWVFLLVCLLSTFHYISKRSKENTLLQSNVVALWFVCPTGIVNMSKYE